MTMSIRLLAFYLISGAALAVDMEVCPLDCFYDATCTRGRSDFSQHPTKNGNALDFHIDTDQQGWHCDCPFGRTGLRCGRKYEMCNDGEHVCYHGGQCLEGLKDIYGNTQLYCDCDNAIDENGVNYVGKYCEIATTHHCDETGDAFCVNAGFCKENYQLSLDSPCQCGTDYEGPHCEFDKGSVPPCSLECENGGTCKLGIRKDVPGEDAFLYNLWKNHSNYQYCECPKGTFGERCEVKSSRCGEHHCFHGGECTQTRQPDGDYLSHCDCSRAGTRETTFVGQFCQYESKMFCDESLLADGQDFCLNGGSCTDLGSQRGCECPKGFHGRKFVLLVLHCVCGICAHTQLIASPPAICEFKDSPNDATADSPTTTPQAQPVAGPSTFMPTTNDAREFPQWQTTQSPTSYALQPTLEGHVETHAPHETCSLECANGGLCRKGVKDMALLGHFGPELSHFNISHNEDFEHCVVRETGRSNPLRSFALVANICTELPCSVPAATWV